MSKVKLISFDCYGTLIDWKKGVQETLRPLFDDYFLDIDDEHIFRLFAEFDENLVMGDFMSYDGVLHEVMKRYAQRLNVNIQPSDTGALAESLPSWPPFEDSVPSLLELKNKGFRLAVISNVDRPLLDKTLANMDFTFDLIVTSDEIGSYKPSPENFLEALRRFHLPVDEIIHVAQSHFHDILPARDLGITAAWINRYNDPVPPLDEEYAGLRFPGLASFVEGLANIEGC
ncbi:MAG TPA: haloacid dehalogenase type II [Bacteroidales bacterium]|nr:haloacid dehalogenase type II [Bacteroidales bacterium]